MPTTLTAGDIAIIGFNFTNSLSSNPQTFDEITFVALTTLDIGTEIKFTDRGWKTTSPAGFFAHANDGTYTWNAPSAIQPGTVTKITFPAPTASVDPNLSPSSDQVLAYQGTDANPTFIYAIHIHTSSWTNATGSTTTALPPGLTDGTAVAITAVNNTYHNGYYDNSKAGNLTFGTKEQWLAAISNKNNWTGQSTRLTLSTASFGVGADTTPPTAEIVDVTPDPRNTNAGTVTVNFTENVTGVDITDFTLTRTHNGVSSNINLSGITVGGSGSQYTLNLSTVTTAEGSYNLVLNANTSIKDAANNTFALNASDTWEIDTTAPTVDIVDISPDPRNTAVSTVTVDFSEDVTGVDITDFTLTKDGTTNIPLTGIAVTQNPSDTTQYTLDLSTLTNAAGSYVLSLNTSNITDLASNALSASASDSWSFVNAPTADIIDITPDPRNSAVGVVTVDFSQEVSNVDITDFALTRNGTNVSLAGIAVTKSVADPTQYTLNLSTLTTTDGTYVLTLNPSNIKDAANNSLAASVNDTWVVDKTAPTANIVDVTPDPRSTHAGVVTVDFTEDVTGVDIADFTLTQNGTNVSLAGLSVTPVNAKQYTLDLSSVTANSGTYVLSLNAATAGIKDAANNAFVVNATDSWVTDATAPTVDIVDITPDPRNAAVGAVTLNFSENVTGVDIADFSLTRDGTNVPLSGNVTQVNAKQYTLNLTNFTAVSGNYTLTLNAATAGIKDSLNNALVVDASDSWVTDATVPTADIVDISPDPRNNAVGVVTVDFSEDVTGVNIADFRLTRNGTNVSLTSVPFVQVNPKQYTLDLTSVSGTSGNYVLSLNAANSGIKDLRNNNFATSVTDSWVTDTTGLSADIVDVSPDPRNSAVGAVNINFNTTVMGVDINDFALTQDGNSVDISGLTVGGSGSQYTLDLSSVTTTAGNYVLTLNAAGSGIQDSLSNTLSANATDAWVKDDTAPTLSSVNPTDDAINVPVTNNLSVTLNEAIKKGTGNVTIKKVADDSVVQTIDVTTTAVTVSGSTLTINPPANLAITTEYYVSIDSGAIEDLAGNDFAGITNNTDWTFTTASTLPTIPGGGSTGGGSTGGGSTGGGSTGGGSTGGGSTGGGSTGGGSTGGGSTGGGTTDTPDSTDNNIDNPPVNVPTPTVLPVHPDFQPNVTIDNSTGGDTDDFLLGNAVANEISGLGGQDTLLGLDANDNLFGNDGDDVMFGNQGADYMDGGNGNDRILAGKEDDAAKGGADNDILMGDFGNDRLAGDAGNDILFGNVGEDCLDGGDGDDWLFGGQGNDTVIGGVGNDILSGDLGDDVLTGGVGADRFDFRPDGGINIIADFADGQDIIGLQAGLTFEQLTIAQVGNDTRITVEELSITLQGVSSVAIDPADFALV